VKAGDFDEQCPCVGRERCDELPAAGAYRGVIEGGKPVRYLPGVEGEWRQMRLGLVFQGEPTP
jgi:hypothetical protein